MRRGRVGAYLVRYQVLDFLVYRASLPALIAVGLGGALVSAASHGIDFATPAGARWAGQFLGTFGTLFIHLSAFLGVARIVSDDRSTGTYRFLFAKPVSATRFYVQQWLLHGVLLTVVAAMIAALAARALAPAPVSVGGIAGAMALTWILVGGVGFALSAATNYDALVLILFFVASETLHALKDVPHSPMWPWLQQLTRVTMPLHKLAYLRDGLLAGDGVSWPHAAHVVAYGAVGFALAVVTLRRASLAR